MLPSSLLEDTVARGCPVLLVGDPAQLPPVNDAGAVTPEDFHYRVILSEIHRQEHGSSILDYASQVRSGGNWRPDRVDPSCRVIRNSELQSELRRAYLKYGVEDTVILCGTNVSRVHLNNLGLQVHKDIANRPDTDDFFDGVPVVCLDNHTSTLLNGSRGVLQSARVDDYWVRARVNNLRADRVFRVDMFGPQFDRPTTLRSYEEVHRICPGLPSEDWTDRLGVLFDFGYALTVHKSQGSSFPCVFVKLEFSAGSVGSEEFRRWLYTAITRAEKEVVLVTG